MRIDVLSSAAPLLTSAQATGVNQGQQIAEAENGVAAVSSSAAAQLVRNVSMETREVSGKSEVEDDDPVISSEEIDKLVNRGNSLFKELHLNEQFQLRRHEKLPRTMIRLVDIQQDRVIREYPPQKYLDLVAALQELSGLMLDERV